MKTDYGQDINLARHAGHVFWDGALILLLLGAPWLFAEYWLAQLTFVLIYAIAGLGLMLLAGHLQIALYCFGLVTAYAVFRILPHVKTHWPALLGSAGLLLAMAFGLAAPQLLPASELARVPPRAGGAPTRDRTHG